MPLSSLTPVARARLSHRISTPTSPTSPEPVKSPDLLEEQKVVEEELNELSRQFYLIQIKDLEERLGRYQAKCDKLQLENVELQKQLRQQLEDQEQMIMFLKRKNQEQAEQYIDLDEKLIVLQQAKDAEREKFEQQIAQMKENSQRALDQVRSIIMY